MNVHEITQALQRLPERVGAGSPVRCHMAAKSKLLEGDGGTVFGVGMVFEPDARIRTIDFRSDTNQSNEQRGLLVGVLTLCEWMHLNTTDEAAVTLLSNSQYIYIHLKKQLSKWLAEPERPNRDILEKIARHRHEFDRIDFRKAVDDDPAFLEAERLAEKRRHSDSTEVRSEDLFGPMDDDPDLAEAMNRAIARDPY